jgi:hypothetical protein
VADLVVPAGLLLGALGAALLALWRRDDLAEALVAAVAILGLLLLLAGGQADDLLAGLGGGVLPLQPGPEPPTPGRPLVGLIVAALFSASALRALGLLPAAGLVAAASALAGAGASAAVVLGGVGLYAGAVLAALGGWLAAGLDRATGPSALRGAARYAVLCLVADLCVLAAALAAVPTAGLAGLLALAGVARLRLFPFHGLTELARLSGRAYLSSVLFGGLVGVVLLARAGAADGGWLGPALGGLALATALAAALALPLAGRYRVALDLTGWVDAAHVAAALALGTPLALAVGLLYALSSHGARALLLMLADATSARGQPRRRPPGALTLLPFGLGFGSLVGMPPLPGFVARWLVYLALLESAAWPLALALVLALVAAGALAELLRRIAAFGAPALGPAARPRALVAALALLWLPLGLVVVTPLALLGRPLADAVASLRPDVAWSLGLDQLLSVRGVLALLLALLSVVAGFALYAERELGPLRRPLASGRRLTTGALGSGAGRAALAGLPWRWLGGFGELLGSVLTAALAPWEERFLAVGVVATGLVVVLVALG